MRLVLLTLAVLLPAFLQNAAAQVAEDRLTNTLEDLAQIAQDGDASPLYDLVACLDDSSDVEGSRVVPCAYEGDPRMESTVGALVTALADALPPDAEWVSDAITTRTFEGHTLTEMQVHVHRGGDLVGQPVFLFADHLTRSLLVQVNRGPSMLLTDAPLPKEPSVLNLPILHAPDLHVQLPARAAFLQRAAAGEVSVADAAALIFCRVYPGQGRSPAPCSTDDAAQRVSQVLTELDLAFGDVQITPRTEAVVVPHQIEGVPGAQVQFEIAGRRPTLFFIDIEDTYLYMSAHPDMDPLTPSVPDAQPRLEALLADLLGWVEDGDHEAAALHFVYRGDGPDRWQRALDPSNTHDLAAAEGALRQLARILGAYDAYTVTSYLTDTESEGTWHVLETVFEAAGEAETVIFAFLFIDDVFVLGDVD